MKTFSVCSTFSNYVCFSFNISGGERHLVKHAAVSFTQLLNCIFSHFIAYASSRVLFCILVLLFIVLFYTFFIAVLPFVVNHFRNMLLGHDA